MNNMHDDGLVGNYAAEENDCCWQNRHEKELDGESQVLASVKVNQ